MSVEIFDNYKRPKSNMEKGGGERITEAAGYIPVRVQVQNMIIAGERLGEYRREKYDFGEGSEVDEDVDSDPTRNPAFDLADGSRMARESISRLKMQYRANKVEKKAVEPPAEEPPKKDV